MITLNDSYRKLNIESDSKRDYLIDINIKSNKYKQILKHLLPGIPLRRLNFHEILTNFFGKNMEVISR